MPVTRQSRSLGTYRRNNQLNDEPVSYPVQAPPSYPGYGNRYTGNDLNRQISSDREYAFGRGDELNQQSRDRAADQSGIWNNYRRYADEVYDPLIGGRGGYSPEEIDQITRGGEFDQFMTSGGEYDENFLTPEEQAAIYGQPWNRAAYFNPDAMEGRQNESAGYQRAAVNELQSGLYDSLDQNLGLSDEYSQGVDSTLANTATGVYGSYDPRALRANAASLDRIRMTPEEEQDIITKAGISGGMKYKAGIGQIDRNARAAGIDPVGAGALRGRYLRDSAADAADAMTLARVQASNARAGREATAEGIRMGGERTAADIGTGAALALGNQRLGATTTREGMRLGAEGDISSRRADLAKTVGQARLGSEQAINAQQRQQQQYNTSLGTDIATGIESDEVARANQIAQNRQATLRANQGQKFQQGMTRNDALSGRYGNVANVRRGDSQEGRAYLRYAQDQSNQNAQNEYNRQANLYATTGQLVQGTTRNQQAKDAQPKWWEKVIAGGIAAAGPISKAFGG